MKRAAAPMPPPDPPSQRQKVAASAPAAAENGQPAGASGGAAAAAAAPAAAAAAPAGAAGASAGAAAPSGQRQPAAAAANGQPAAAAAAGGSSGAAGGAKGKKGQPQYAPPSTAPSAQLNQHSNRQKPRRPYTITKKRETWTEEEHRRFLEALHFYHRDWKKIAAHVGTRSVFQARSHAQKYFSKVIKYGTGEYVPAPRPKKKARIPKSKEGIASRGTHWTPADIPAGQIKEEPQVPPMYFDRLHGEQASDSDELTTPSMVRRKPPRRPAPLCHPSRDQSGCMILI